MRDSFVKYISFFGSIMILFVILKIVNWLPMTIQKETVRTYRSVEEIRSKLNVKKIYVPSYFPQSFKWPPSRITAQGKPFIAVVMEFEDIDNEDVALIISQSASSDFQLDDKIKVLEINQKVNYELNGRESLLEVGICEPYEPFSRISWNEGEYLLRVTMKSPPFELIKISESMLH